MTNQEWLCSLSAEDFLFHIKWLLQNYGKRWTDSDLAIIEWLQDKHEVNTPEDKGMTNEQAKDIIEKYLTLDSDVDSEYIQAQKVAVEALKQNEELRNMVKMGIAKDCESCKAHRIDVLDKIRTEIKGMTPTYHNPNWSITDLVPISEVLKVIDKYKAESEE